jgi:hypothetical protein
VVVEIGVVVARAAGAADAAVTPYPTGAALTSRAGVSLRTLDSSARADLGAAAGAIAEAAPRGIVGGGAFGLRLEAGEEEDRAGGGEEKGWEAALHRRVSTRGARNASIEILASAGKAEKRPPGRRRRRNPGKTSGRPVVD